MNPAEMEMYQFWCDARLMLEEGKLFGGFAITPRIFLAGCALIASQLETAIRGEEWDDPDTAYAGLARDAYRQADVLLMAGGDAS